MGGHLISQVWFILGQLDWLGLDEPPARHGRGDGALCGESEDTDAQQSPASDWHRKQREKERKSERWRRTRAGRSLVRQAVVHGREAADVFRGHRAALRRSCLR